MLVHATVGIRAADWRRGAQSPRIAWTIELELDSAPIVNEWLPRPVGLIDAFAKGQAGYRGRSARFPHSLGPGW
jgi:hypothetical protein